MESATEQPHVWPISEILRVSGTYNCTCSFRIDTSVTFTARRVRGAGWGECMANGRAGTDGTRKPHLTLSAIQTEGRAADAVPLTFRRIKTEAASQ